MEIEEERRARLENDAATKRLSFGLRLISRNELARPVMGTIFLVYIDLSHEQHKIQWHIIIYLISQHEIQYI